MPTTSEARWKCHCRRCLGVWNSADAVQHVWESVFGSCGVPVVVGVNMAEGGFVRCCFVYWHDEPDQPRPITNVEYIVSCRPDAGTIPTEGDVARWAHWLAGPRPPRDWLLVDECLFRSVRTAFDSLRRGDGLPDDQTIVGDWFDATTELAMRREIRRAWEATKRRNRRNRTPS